jgi:hypothetical protein
MNFILCKILTKNTPTEVIHILFPIISIHAASCIWIPIKLITGEIYEIKFNVNVSQSELKLKCSFKA